jgi:hypothetical protein
MDEFVDVRTARYPHSNRRYYGAFFHTADGRTLLVSPNGRLRPNSMSALDDARAYADARGIPAYRDVHLPDEGVVKGATPFSLDVDEVRTSPFFWLMLAGVAFGLVVWLISDNPDALGVALALFAGFLVGYLLLRARKRSRPR